MATRYNVGIPLGLFALIRMIREPGGGTKPAGALSRYITGPRTTGPNFMMGWVPFVGGQFVEDDATINRTPFRAIIAGLLVDTTFVSGETTDALLVMLIPVTVAEEGTGGGTTA